MFFNVALYAGLFLAFEALAVPSGLAAHLTPRREGRQTQVNQPDVNTTSNIPYSNNWAGAVWVQPEACDFPPETFAVIWGAFTVPAISGPVWSYAAAWVGIDGYTCQSATFQTGVTFIVTPNGVACYAWYEWYPNPIYYFPNFTIAVGDTVRAVVLTTSNASGTATIENLTSGQALSEPLNSTTPLCGENAEWVVGDPYGPIGPSFANFGTINFTSAWAGGGDVYTPSGATLVNIEQNGKALTSVTTSEWTVAMEYL